MIDFNLNNKAINVFNELDQFFGNLVDSERFETRSAILPVDVSRDENEYTIKADVPGFSEDEISVEFKNDVLTILAENSTNKNSTTDETKNDNESETVVESQSDSDGFKPKENEATEDKTEEKVTPKVRSFRERVSYRKVERSVRLMKNIDEENISADLKHGVLTVTAPIVPDPESRKIKVNLKWLINC